MGFIDYLKMVEYQILAYSIFVGAVSIYFWSTLFPALKIDVPLSACAGAFLLVVAASGFAAVFTSNDRLKAYYAFFLIAQIVLCFIFAIVSGVTVKVEDVSEQFGKDTGIDADFEEYGPLVGSFVWATKVQTILKCCFVNDVAKDRENARFAKASNLTTIAEKKTPEEISKEYIASCCDDLKEGEACNSKSEKYHTAGCKEVIESKTKTYKTVAIVLFVLAIVFQCLLFFSYYMNARS